MTADLVDCNGGLIKVFNSLGVCVSSDALQRHIHRTTQQSISNKLQQDIALSVEGQKVDKPGEKRHQANFGPSIRSRI